MNGYVFPNRCSYPRHPDFSPYPADDAWLQQIRAMLEELRQQVEALEVRMDQLEAKAEQIKRIGMGADVACGSALAANRPGITTKGLFRCEQSFPLGVT